MTWSVPQLYEVWTGEQVPQHELVLGPDLPVELGQGRFIHRQDVAIRIEALARRSRQDLDAASWFDTDRVVVSARGRHGRAERDGYEGSDGRMVPGEWLSAEMARQW